MHNADHMHAWYDKIEMCASARARSTEPSMHKQLMMKYVRSVSLAIAAVFFMWQVTLPNCAVDPWEIFYVMCY
jgi:hypothetical protein